MSLFLSLLLRCMTASHSLVCANVAQKCSIEGCGHNIRRSWHETHMTEHQGSHVQLLQNQMTKALWNANRVCHLSHVTTELNNPYLLRGFVFLKSYSFIYLYAKEGTASCSPPIRCYRSLKTIYEFALQTGTKCMYHD